MKHVLAALALVALATVPAVANPGGITGHIVRESNGDAIVDVPVFVYRMPVREGDRPISSMRTDKKGYFWDLAVPSGTYLVAARLGTGIVGCSVDRVYEGFMTSMRISVQNRDVQCSGKNVRSALVSPALTADVYLITNGNP